jgi:release factor glutamine methyltransferase
LDILSAPAYHRPVTVLEVIQKSAAFLEKKGVSQARLQSELLLAHVMKAPRLKLYLNFGQELTTAELEQMRELVKRRGQREPLQHLLGTVSFCHYELVVNRHALIPRPETEILAETGWNYLSRLPSERPRALDFGAGTGCLAIGLALKCPTSEIVAIDVSAEALELARQNAAKNGVADRIRFCLGDGFAAVGQERFDLIISNPPYIASAAIAQLEPEVRDYDPRAALDGGADGLNFYRLLAAQGANYLKPAGRMIFEFGEGQAAAIQAIFTAQNWVVETVIRDYSNKERIMTVSLIGDRRLT